jgi:hypothetical protein
MQRNKHLGNNKDVDMHSVHCLHALLLERKEDLGDNKDVRVSGLMKV